ncbi:MAG TPA: NAD-dependent epimerase/dehydratase family protein [Rhodocyclaceae bacterium]|nr:NAD-dependent epimerase/dehydratase family protein [Rhodocyclaceae bacterium]
MTPPLPHAVDAPVAVASPIVAEDVAGILAFPLPWHRLAGKHVLITGAAGMIGGYLLETLAALEGATGQGPARIHALARDGAKLAARHPALCAREDVDFLIQNVDAPITSLARLDYVIHAASPASPKRYLADPVGTIQANVTGTHHLLELAKAHGARLLYLSSGTVYGSADGQNDAMDEHCFGPYDPLDARACYTESKRVAETLCASYGRQHGVETVIARLSHTYGPGADLDDGRVFSDFVGHAVAGQPITLLGSGEEGRAFLYLADAVQALLLLLLEGEAGEAYNLGAENEMTMLELATLVAELAGGPAYPIARQAANASLPPAPRKAGHFDIGKLKALGWQPTTPPAAGFRRMLDHYLSLGR